MRHSMERRLMSLCVGELIAILLFIPVSYLINQASPELHLYQLVSFWYAFILLIIFLLQGSYYWFSKLQRLKKEKTSATPVAVVRLLARFKVINIVLLVIGIAPFIIDIARFADDLPKTGIGIAFCIYAFTILEFINYYYVQLSYDRMSEILRQLKRRQLKPSSLRKDMQRLKKSQ